MSDRIIIGDRYELHEFAGQGGMATVWRGVMHGAAGFTRQVAVKKIKPEFHAIQNYIDMFIEEARVGSDLAHPNIVQIHDFVIDDEGSYYLIMEWVEGIDLGSFTRAFHKLGLPVPWQLLAAAAVGVLHGLGAAHERRRPDNSVAPVIHRDVSPQNILLGINGIVKLTDFGLARARDRAYSLTAPGTVKGKLSYLAPEVTYGKPATPLSDIFSLGNVMWEALVGQKLFQGSTDLDVFKLIRKCHVPPIARLRPDLPPAMAEAIIKALERDPIDRFLSARVMARALVAVLKDVEWREDAHIDLGEMVTRIRTGGEVRISEFMQSASPPRGAALPNARNAGPALLESSGVDVQFTEPAQSSNSAPADVRPAGAESPSQKQTARTETLPGLAAPTQPADDSAGSPSSPSNTSSQPTPQRDNNSQSIAQPADADSRTNLRPDANSPAILQPDSNSQANLPLDTRSGSQSGSIDIEFSRTDIETARLPKTDSENR
ncbi:MAG: serine/threonine protein kinase [Proteobacteria bacterium]|nr:serine/threonine protein kinase [Pseudomonadota bacterium]